MDGERNVRQKIFKRFTYLFSFDIKKIKLTSYNEILYIYRYRYLFIYTFLHKINRPILYIFKRSYQTRSCNLCVDIFLIKYL